MKTLNPQYRNRPEMQIQCLKTKKGERKAKTYMFGLFLDINGLELIPTTKIASHELINLRQEMIFQHGWAY